MSIAEKLQIITDNVTKVWKAGHNNGYGVGHNAGVLDGKQWQYDEFWESYCNNINTDFTGGYGAFAGTAWTKATCKPTKDLKPRYANQMFAYNSCIEDLDAWAEELGITIDFSASTSFQYTFYGMNSTLKEVGVIDTRAAHHLPNTFNGAVGLHTIGHLILKDDGSQNLTGIFSGCKALENITISGKIGFNNIDFSSCTLLTHKSLMSIIYSLLETSTTKVLKIGADNLGKLSEEEKAIATQKGWSLV